MTRWLIVAAAIIAYDYAHGGLAGPAWGYGLAIGLVLIVRDLLRYRAETTDSVKHVLRELDTSTYDSHFEAQMAVVDTLEAHGYVVDRLGDETVSAYKSSTYLPVNRRITVEIDR